jgi:hypothetical protein
MEEIMDTATERRYASYEEFYPFYLSQHADTTCRRLHYIGTSLVIALFLFAIANQQFMLLLALPLCGYFFAWVGHYGFEKNTPASFTYPRWSLLFDFHMFWDALIGRLDTKKDLAVAKFKAPSSAQPSA